MTHIDDFSRLFFQSSTAKEKTQAEEEKRNMSKHFIQVLPTLLQLYSADSEKLANLLAIPQYFDLIEYANNQGDVQLKMLLQKMSKIVKDHHDKDVLETCAKTLEFLCTFDSSTNTTLCTVYSLCNNERSSIIEECVGKYIDAIGRWRNSIDIGEEPSEDETFNVVVSLKKVAILYSCHNLNSSNIFGSLYEEMEKYEALTPESGRGLPVEALIYCIEACYFSLGWELVYLKKHCTAEQQKEGARVLHRNLNKYIGSCTALVASNLGIQIQEAVSRGH